MILYAENETDFTSNGIGVLSDVISCTVSEERNGMFELSMTYPVDGVFFNEITHSKILKEKATPGGTPQLFRIYEINKPINGVVTVNAEHISYQLAYIPVAPFTAQSAVAAVAGIGTNAMSACPFTFWTDKETVANFKLAVPANARSLLGGTQGSILDVYGGEWEFDNYTIKLHNHRGQDRGVVLGYGKNITDIEQDENIAETYTSIVGTWASEDEEVHTPVIDSATASAYPYKRVKIVDFSGDYEEKPTVAQLTSKATSYMNANNFGIPKISINVSFVALWQTEEYKDIAPLERVYLCDTVSVHFEKLGITANAKVIKTVYNPLLDRYDSIELGEARSNLTQRMADQTEVIKRVENNTTTEIARAVSKATELITGQAGGNIVLRQNADGKPYEILIMDTDDMSTAQKVWRWNLSGWGYSSTGINGPYTFAATQNGEIVADFITVGTLTASLIKAGLLSDAAGINYWNMVTGDLRMTSGAKVLDINTDYSGAYVPTNNNYPASGWTTTALRKQMLGKTFLDTVNKEVYQWTHGGVFVHFSLLDTEQYYDYIKFYWYDENGNLKQSNTFSGSLGNYYIYVPSEEFYMYWHADSYVDANGWTMQDISIDQPSGWSWVDVSDASSLPIAVTDIVNGVSSLPQTDHPYTGPIEKLYLFNTELNSYNWVKTDGTLGSYVNDRIEVLDDELDQQGIFNRLTNNGQAQGIYMQNGNLYINGAYIATGILADAQGNITWNLSTGHMVAKNFSIDTHNFTLSESGNMSIYGYPENPLNRHAVDISGGVIKTRDSVNSDNTGGTELLKIFGDRISSLRAPSGTGYSDPISITLDDHHVSIMGLANGSGYISLVSDNIYVSDGDNRYGYGVTGQYVVGNNKTLTIVHGIITNVD